MTSISGVGGPYLELVGPGGGWLACLTPGGWGQRAEVAPAILLHEGLNKAAIHLHDHAGHTARTVRVEKDWQRAEPEGRAVPSNASSLLCF